MYAEHIEVRPTRDLYVLYTPPHALFPREHYDLLCARAVPEWKTGEVEAGEGLLVFHALNGTYRYQIDPDDNDDPKFYQMDLISAPVDTDNEED